MDRSIPLYLKSFTIKALLLIIHVTTIYPSFAQISGSMRRGNYRDHHTQAGQPARTAHHTQHTNPHSRSKHHPKKKMHRRK